MFIYPKRYEELHNNLVNSGLSEQPAKALKARSFSGHYRLIDYFELKCPLTLPFVLIKDKSSSF